jgi:hypothetical protein
MKRLSRQSWLVAFSILAIALAASVSHADEGGNRYSFYQKSDRKEKSRWTLQEWLEQKQRNHLMDLWLDMYAPSPYEFFLEGSFGAYETHIESSTTNTKQHHESFSGAAGAYATVVGLEGSYENNPGEKYNQTSGSFHLRVLGNAVQGTHLILHYGLSTRYEDFNGTQVRLNQQFAGGDINLYFNHHFGVQGLYDYYLPVTNETLGDVNKNRFEAGLFIDFKALRVFGVYFQEQEKNKNAGTETTTTRTGVQSGIRFFF